MRFVIMVTLVLCFRSEPSHGQTDIPLGQWRAHISFNSINGIAVGNSKIYASTSSGLMILDQQDKSISSYSKLNGLSGRGVKFIGYHESSASVLLAYDDGSVDILQSNTISNFDRLTGIPVPGSRSIHHIAFSQQLAYLSSDYGVVVFDVVRREIKETWRDLGEGGIRLNIHQSAILEDSIFLATEKGVMAGNLNDNLLDYNSWKRYSEGDLTGSVHAVSAFNGNVYAVIDNVGLFRHEGGQWMQEGLIPGVSFQNMNASPNNLVICGTDRIWRLSAENVLTETSSPIITHAQFATEDSSGTLWIGDEKNGLLSINDNTGENSYLPNGPAFNRVNRIRFFDSSIYALEGGYSEAFLPNGKKGRVSIFSGGQWTTKNSPMNDLTDVERLDGATVLSSFGFGVQSGTIESPDVIYNENNSTLINANPPGNSVFVTALAPAEHGTWVANYNASSSIHWFSNGTWEAHSFPHPAARFPTEVSVDLTGSVWAVLDPARGGGILVYNRNENLTAYLTEQPDAGGLPSRNVNCVSLDREGSLWVGTDNGVAYYANPSTVFGNVVNPVRPVFENRFLLNGEKITAMAVDGGNRKWIGTERGVWLFGPDGDELVYNFTSENSPLISDHIRGIAINPVSGEVFFGTDQGMVSFRSDATAGKKALESVKIFPNPVTYDFQGWVGIDGLSTDAIVKITDVSGKLIWQTRANGGTASWNIRDYKGRRAGTGIYLIFTANDDGSQLFVGKIAVIE